MGVDSDDYARLVLEDLPNIEAWSGIGTSAHGIPNRISYHLDLMGPSVAVDAACASSLIALHMGRQAILSGESSVAICGGVNVLCAPALTHMLKKAGALSPDGVCVSFDDDACGYARGEGGAVIVLKRLANAVADNDNILAVLKGTATAQDGKTNGIMAPNATAQEMVARKALMQAGDIDPLTIGYVEAHATSTSLGDPTEVCAISSVYGSGRPIDSPCAIGSIKPNVGHLEAAAGAIGLVKAVLAVNKGQLAPQTLLRKLNSRIDWEASGLKVVQETAPWPVSDGPRRAACCSYGYGGSVAHAIIEQAPPVYPDTAVYPDIPNDITISTDDHSEPVPLHISSFQEKRLPKQAKLLADWLESDGRTVSLKSLANTLAQRRAAHDYRASFIVESHEEACRVLRDFSKKRSNSWIASNRVLGNNVQRDGVWVYSGHGAQWNDMGKELLENNVFRQTIVSLESVIQTEAGFSALEALQCGEIGGSHRVQVLTYLMQVGLTKVLKSKGIEPQAIIGHSVGEIAASVAAGCLTAVEGAVIVSRRAKLYQSVQGKDGMLFVTLPFHEVEAYLKGRNDLFAAINSSPSSCVVSGKLAAIEEYVRELDARGVQTFRVKTDIAFHSPILDGLVQPLRDALAGSLNPRPPSVPLYSTSRPDPRTEFPRNVEYWTSNMVNPVRLCEAVQAAVDDGWRIFLEVSAHPIVSHSINDVLTTRKCDESATVGVMQRGNSSHRSIAHAIAQLHTLGVDVDYSTQLGKTWSSLVPGTPWVQKPYWKKVETNSGSHAKQHDVDKHTLLGQSTRIADSTTRVFATLLDDKTKPYPLSHPLDGTEIIPAAVYCNTFCQATGANILEDIQLIVPTVMTADQREVQVVTDGQAAQLFSRMKTSKDPEDENMTWTKHSSCAWSKRDMAAYRRSHDISAIKKRIGTRLPNEFSWNFLQSIGVSGIAYPWAVLEHYGNEKEMIIKVDMDPDNRAITWDQASWAPFLDAATSIGSSIFFKSRKMRIVSGIDQVQIISAGHPSKTGYLYVQDVSDKSLAASISILDETGDTLAKLEKMRFSEVDVASDAGVTGPDELCYQMAWIPPVFAETPTQLANVLLISDDVLRSRIYTAQLHGRVERLVQVTSVEEMDEPHAQSVLDQNNTVVVFVPKQVESLEEVPEKAHAYTWDAARITKKLAGLPILSKLFIITANVQRSKSPAALAHAPLHGFARIAAQEHPEIWGGLVDTDDTDFPFLALKYAPGHDVIHVSDGLPRIARLRPFASSNHRNTDSKKTLLPKPHGTYIVTGGFGDLGLEVIDFLSRKGARRIVVVSRRKLPARREWRHLTGPMKTATLKIENVEKQGTTLHSIALDIGAPDACEALTTALDALSLPPVLGIVHAAGTSEDSLIKDVTCESVGRVFNPKVSGALALHEAFPPGLLDFFVLFSSIGQLVGTPGQAPYGAANAFLDALATHRRAAGDNSVAFQWTAWRGMGLARDAAFLHEELKAKGITDISCEEGFRAWEEADRLDAGHVVVTRSRVLDEDEQVPFPLVAEIVRRRRAAAVVVEGAKPRASLGTTTGTATSRGEALEPSSLMARMKQCMAAVLHLDVEEIDERAAIADLGVDSVMGAALRREMQKKLGVKMSPSLFWKVDTVGKLHKWACEEIRRGGI